MKKALAYVLILSAFFVLTLYPEYAASAVTEALKKTVGNVLPALFPFMVISDIALGLGGCIGGRTARKRSSRFGETLTVCLPSLILSTLSGFPVGAKNAAKMREMGILSREGSLIFAVLANNAGPSFVISFVGASLFSSKKTGIVLYLIQLGAAVVVCLLLIVILLIKAKRKFIKEFFFASAFKNARRLGNDACNNKTAESLSKKRRDIPRETKRNASFGSIFGNAVTDAALSSLSVTGFITAFAVVISYVTALFEKTGAEEIWRAIISAVLEISNGCMSASETSAFAAFLICAFAIGFSGISVIFQSLYFLEPADIDTRLFLMCKLFQGGVSVILACLTAVNAPGLCHTGTVQTLAEVTKWTFEDKLLSLTTIVIIVVYLAHIIKNGVKKLVKKRKLLF